MIAGQRPASAPTDPRERAPAIDALRGWALLGIAIVNVPWIAMPQPLITVIGDETQRARLAPIDLAAAVFIEAVCESRFYPIFSALFGFGTGLLVARSTPAYLRRIAALLVFGVLHALFGWYGDVLINYAVVGLVLLPLARLSPRQLFGIAGIILVITELASLRFDDWVSGSTSESLAWVEESIRIYRDGTFLTITEQRFEDLLGYFTLPWNVSYRCNVLAMATLGLAIERSGVHRRLAELRPQLCRLAIALAAIGAMLLAIAYPLGRVQQVYLLACDAIAGAYALGFLWLATSGARAARALSPLVALGRMALSGYLLQTVAFTLLFYGYGLALFGSIPPAGLLAIAIAVYAAEAIFAARWLERFAHGPIEWIWRALTYLRPPPMRLERS